MIDFGFFGSALAHHGTFNEDSIFGTCVQQNSDTWICSGGSDEMFGTVPGPDVNIHPAVMQSTGFLVGSTG
jgi:hypothetical protein